MSADPLRDQFVALCEAGGLTVEFLDEDVVEAIIVQDDDGIEREMCPDNTHPHHYLCVKFAGHSGRHCAEFASSRDVVEW